MPRIAKPRPQAYLVSVKQGSERAVQARLREIGVRSYCPRYLEYPASGPVEVVLFEEYLFVYVLDQWSEVRHTKGVYDFVMFGDRFAKVQEKHLNELRKLEGPTGYIRLRERLKPGQKAKLVGPQGSIVQVLEHDGALRVRVLLEMLGRSVKMSVHEDQLLAL